MLKITNDFISPEEEQEILSHIKPSRVVSGTGRNRVLRYGSKLPYNAPMQGKQIPSWLDFVAQRLLTQGYLDQLPDHATINEYQKGQSIDWHIDSASSGPVITVISLLSDATMALHGINQKEESVFKQFVLPARSLLQMSEEDRWDLKHCIFPVLGLRYSIVFRKGTK